MRRRPPLSRAEFDRIAESTRAEFEVLAQLRQRELIDLVSPSTSLLVLVLASVIHIMTVSRSRLMIELHLFVLRLRVSRLRKRDRSQGQEEAVDRKERCRTLCAENMLWLMGMLMPCSKREDRVAEYSFYIEECRSKPALIRWLFVLGKFGGFVRVIAELWIRTVTKLVRGLYRSV